MRRFFAFFAQLMALIAGLVLAQPAYAQPGWRPNPDDALLFDVRAGRYRVGDGVRGYATPDGVCLDLADTIIALDLPVRLDKKSRRATGWIFAESRTLTVDREKNAVQIVNRSEQLAPRTIVDSPEGWCVSVPALSRWLGVQMIADQSNALLILKSDAKLPFELAAERRARAAGIRPAVAFDLKSLPQAEAPFGGVRMPAIDAVVTLGGLHEKGRGGRFETRYELYASGEVGPVAYDARLASTRGGTPDTLRVRAYRTDPDGGLLGPLKATHVAAGDVSGLSTPLVSVSSAGRGAVVTNRPVDRPDSFDRTDFRGELPAGWDAELYRNGQLLEFANNRADGRYEFLDVPLLYGQNRFEIVLYGPQGQVRREERNVPVGLDSIPPQQTWYWAGINEPGRDLIGLRTGPRFGRQGWRGTVGLERGLDPRTSIAALGHSLVIDDAGRRSYGELALRRAIGPALAEFSGSYETRGGYALRGNMLGELGKTYIGVETIWAGGGYRSERVLKNVTGLHTFSIDHPLSLGRTIIPVHFDTRYTRRRTGDDTLEAALRTSASLGRIAVTGELGWRDERKRFGPDPPGVMEAGLLANARVGRVRLRGETRFRLTPDTRFQSATLVGEWTARADAYEGADWRAELGYDRLADRARAGLGYVRRFDKFALTASAEAATDGSVAAGLNLAFSLGPDPRARGGIRVSSAKLASSGQTLARVFRDANGDGVRQPGERLEPDVQLAAGRTPVERLTDKAGEVIIEGLEPFQPVLIGIDASSLPDPLLQPKGPGVVVTPRPGRVVTIDLPLVSAGEVDGTLVRAGGGSLEGVDLELLDAEGRVAARTRSDFDGFFLFEGVPYGRYTVRIARLSADASRIDTRLTGAAIVGDATPTAHLGTLAAEPAGQRTAAK